MHVEWYGQSAFTLTGPEATVFIDPFGDMSGAGRARDRSSTTRRSRPTASTCCSSPTSTSTTTASRRSAASPQVLRSTAGRHESPIGEVRRRSPPSTTRRPAPSAGRTRSSSSSSTALRVAHFGDFGQARAARRAGRGDRRRRPALPPGRRRPDDRRRAGGRDRRARSAPRWVVPMHYRTERVDFLRDRGGVRRPDAAGRRLEALGLRHRRPARRGRPDRRRPRRALAFTSASSTKGAAPLWSPCRA